MFDYGCGRGDDLRHLAFLGYNASDWDPVLRPDHERRSASVVNIGYVVNVIKNVNERADTLRRAWALAKQGEYRKVRGNQSIIRIDKPVAERIAYQKNRSSL